MNTVLPSTEWARDRPLLRPKEGLLPMTLLIAGSIIYAQNMPAWLYAVTGVLLVPSSGGSLGGARATTGRRSSSHARKESYSVIHGPQEICVANPDNASSADSSTGRTGAYPGHAPANASQRPMLTRTCLVRLLMPPPILRVLLLPWCRREEQDMHITRHAVAERRDLPGTTLGTPFEAECLAVVERC
jgi:hypothetical protein